MLDPDERHRPHPSPVARRDDGRPVARRTASAQESAVNLQDAAASITSSAGADTGTDAAAVEGTWSVDTSIGEFSYDDSTGTFVGVRVDVELTGIGSTTAVGRTPDVSGTIVAVGSIDITFSDSGVSVPSAPMVVSAEDTGTLEIQVYLSR